MTYVTYNLFERDRIVGMDDGPVYSKQEIDAIVDRLNTLKHAPQPEPSAKQRKPVSMELKPWEKEIVDRLTRQPVIETVQPITVSPVRTVTNKEMEEILQRLTQRKPDIPEPAVSAESKKVSIVEMENILSRLMTFNSEKWPPESKPHIYRLHTK